MAIKSKSRRKRGGNKTMGTPARRPSVARVPFTRRPLVRLVAGLIAGAILIVSGLLVWKSVSRTNELKAYLRALAAAQTPALPHLTPATSTYLDTTAQSFIERKTATAAFLAVADQWETDFRTTKTNVAALKPPAHLREAQRLLVAGWDQYIGVARLYNLAAQQRAVSAAQPVAGRQAVEDKVQVTLTHAREWADRAAAIYSMGGEVIERYRLGWLGIASPREVAGVPKGLLPPESVPN